MEFSSSNVAASGFRPLSRGTSVVGNQEFNPDPLKQFQTIAETNPEADRLIMSEDGLDVIAAPKPFFGIPIEIIFGRSEKETSQNKTILEKFQEALIRRYGTRVTDFAFPDLHRRLLQGTKLDAKTIQDVLKDASLFEEIFANEGLRQNMNEAVATDIEAMSACAEFEKTSEKHDQLYAEAQLAHKNKESAAASVTQHIKRKIDSSNLVDDPKHHALQELQTLWRAASLETPENPEEDLTIFETAARETDPLKRDRLVLSRERTRLTPAPRPAQGWTGAAIQWIAGRSENSTAENRRTIEGFRLALTRKYGHTVANFSFPTSQSRHETGSRLNSETIQRTLEKAKQASELLHDPNLKNLMTQWTSAVRQAEGAEARYRAAKIEREELGREKDAKLASAEHAYKQADNHILNYLTARALSQNITIAQSARLHHLWFDEARARYKKAQAEMSPSAPPQHRSFNPPSATNPYHQNHQDVPHNQDGNSTWDALGAVLMTRAQQFANFIDLDNNNDPPSAPPPSAPSAIPIAEVVQPEKNNIYNQ